MKSVLITGAAGFVGAAVTQEALRRGYSVVAHDLRPGPPMAGVVWHTGDLSSGIDSAHVSGLIGVIHLAGHPIFGRWTLDYKRRIRDSRVLGTRALVSAMKQASKRPFVLVSASAMGYYGDGGERDLTETDPPGDDFLASVCMEWEAEAQTAAALGCRVVLVRTAHVLGKGGILRQLEKNFRLFAGGWFGNGNQWMSWISLDDLARLYLDAIENDLFQGPINAASPRPVRQKDFMKAVGTALGKPAWLPIPSWPIRLAYGDFVDVFLVGQKLVPKRLAANGFSHAYPSLSSALARVYGK